MNKLSSVNKLAQAETKEKKQSSKGKEFLCILPTGNFLTRFICSFRILLI